MSVEIKGLEQALINIDKYSATVQKKITDTITMSAINIRTEAMRSIKGSPATGRTYARGNIRHTASSPGNPPRVDTGRLWNSIRWVTSETDAVVGVFGSMSLSGRLLSKSDGLADSTRSDYASYLEFGTKNMQARPFLFPAFERERREFVSKLTQALKATK